jgi:hypothetical protein
MLMCSNSVRARQSVYCALSVLMRAMCVFGAPVFPSNVTER